MKTMYKYLTMMVAALLMAACVDHEPQVEPLPQEQVSFTYYIPSPTDPNEKDYSLDYYVDAEITFINTSIAEGEAVWSFGDDVDARVGDTVVYPFSKAGTYTVTLRIGELKKEQPIMISPIKPIMTLKPIPGGLCEVFVTPIEIDVELPNPQKKTAVYTWSFPPGTLDEAGNVVTTSNKVNPGKMTFSNVGSQTVKLNINLGGEDLEEAFINVQVGYMKAVPTLYYAEKGGNIKALKLAENDSVNIYPFDLGVSSGQHPFNLIFADSTLFLLDAGKQFYYVNDVDGNLGDGKISAIAKDGSKVETVITNVGGAAFDDPFYGYAEDGWLYYSNRNTGVVQISTKARDQVYTSAAFPWYFQNATTTYYKQGIEYGAISGCFGKVNGTWYMTKIYNAKGIFRFLDTDILKEPIYAATGATPGAGIALGGYCPRAFAHYKDGNMFYFTLLDESLNTIFGCKLDDLEGSKTAADLEKMKLQHVDGLALDADISGKAPASEGHSTECVGICQLAVDETTGCIYFGFRPAADDATQTPKGLMRYNPAIGKVETVIPGIDVYGVTINPTPSKLF